MIIKSFPDVIILPTQRDVLRVHLYTKFLEHGIRPLESDIDIVLELYCFGGYTEDSQSQFFQLCLEKKYKKTEQSVRNTLSKYTTLGVLDKPRNKYLNVSSEYIPRVSFDMLVLEHKVTHADGLQADLQGISRENGQVGADI